MFTGIIEKQGKVQAHYKNDDVSRLEIAADFGVLQIGESISVNGVCLTLLPSENDCMHFDVSPETMKVTTLGELVAGDCVNLERAMLSSTRLGGHYVSGHVDSKMKVASVRPLNEFLELELEGFDEKATLYLIPKGSITVEGVSLTINQVADQRIQLMLVPHTLSNTTLGGLKVGQLVNIEFDYLTRIVAHQLQLLGKAKKEVAL